MTSEDSGSDGLKKFASGSNKSVPTPKNLIDRVDRRINNMTDMESLIFISSAASKLFGFHVDLSRVKRQWPVLSVLKEIRKAIKEIRKEIKKNVGTGKPTTELPDEMHQRLNDMARKIEMVDEQRQKDSTKVENLQKLFLDKDVSLEKLKEELLSAFPWLFEGENETNGPTADQDQGSLPSREQLQNQIFAMDNNKVDVSDFPGLQEAMEKTTGWRHVPDYLEPIAIRIEKARGTATEFAHINIQLLVCAAIQEMENLPVGALDLAKLFRWAAALIKAEQLGFSVEFAVILFYKNLYAFFAWYNIQ